MFAFEAVLDAVLGALSRCSRGFETAGCAVAAGDTPVLGCTGVTVALAASLGKPEATLEAGAPVPFR